MRFDTVYAFLTEKLEKELPSSVTYHNAEHTKNVILAVQHLNQRENITEQEAELLLVAALFHDAGFLKGYDDHEELSCELAKETLPSFHYTTHEIEKVCRLIMATKLPQKPADHLEEILCDADLFYLGSDNYFEGAEGLHAELTATGKMNADADWIKFQIDFLKKHRYFTLTALKEQEQKKKENLQHLLVQQQLQKIIKKNKPPLYAAFADLFFIVLGILIAGFALKGFLVPNHFF